MFTVAIERGPKGRSLAQVQGWIGWLRIAKDEPAALEALLSTGSRYAILAAKAGVPFTPPASITDFTIIEHVTGNDVTDFGAPGVLCDLDKQPWQADEIDLYARLLRACWRAFDEALAAIPEPAVKPKRGRAPQAMRLHLVETDLMHLSAFGPAARPADANRVAEQETEIRDQMILGLRAITPGEQHTPRRRYGFDWTPRFALRRSAWHALDHAWELQDRFSTGDS